jgi:hypothetical protein
VLLGIDHLVIAVRDPDAAAAELERDAGIAFAGGGRHEGGGTFNRLAFFADTYLELIGVFDRSLVRSADWNHVGRAALALLDEGREGLATYAIATDDVAGDVAALRSGGSPIGTPVAGSRVRPDGEVVRWITAFPVLGPQEPPFLIEHELEGAEWGKTARADRASFRQLVGGRVRVTDLTLPVRDPAAVANAYGSTLGLAFGTDGHARIEDQVIRLLASNGSDGPVVDLVGDPGTPDLDLARHGVRWRRVAHP